MGLFNWLRAKSGTEQEEKPKLSVLSGKPVQVRTPDGAYLFNAVVQPVTQNAAFLNWYGGLDPKTIRSQMPETYPAALRFCQKETGHIYHASGVVRQTGPQTWAMAQITLSEDESDREDFRKPITFWGRASFPDKNGVVIPFQSTDLSAQGIGLLIERLCLRDEKILLTAPLLEKMDIPSLLCLVRYTVRVAPSSYHCGCRLIDMDPQRERTISRLVMQIQVRGDTFVE